MLSRSLELARQPTETSEALDEQALAADIRRGNPEAFDRLVVAYFNAMARYAAAVLGSSENAEDVAQEVLMRVWRGRSTWTVSTSVKSYLLTGVRHEALNRLRHERGRERTREGLTMVANEDAPDAADAITLRADLTRVINTLSARRREAVLLRYVEGMSFPQVAEVLGVSTKAAEQLVMRALRALRDRLPG